MGIIEGPLGGLFMVITDRFTVIIIIITGLIIIGDIIMTSG